MKFLIVDGNNLLYRCYYAAQHLDWESDIKTIFIFLRVMISLLKKNYYQKLLVVFDDAKLNFRHDIFPGYKTNRLATPHSLLSQVKILQNLLIDTDIKLVKLPNYEADDLIASFVYQNSNSDIIDILSQDKDLLQLLSPQVNICKYFDKQIITYCYDDFLKKYEFLPINYIDYLSLLGDKVDNIKGVEGIGHKKAQQLIKQFGTVENLYRKIESLSTDTEINFRVKELIKKNKELVYRNKQLISLKKDLDIKLTQKCDFYWDEWRKNDKLINFCQSYEFNSILKLLFDDKQIEK